MIGGRVSIPSQNNRTFTIFPGLEGEAALSGSAGRKVGRFQRILAFKTANGRFYRTGAEVVSTLHLEAR